MHTLADVLLNAWLVSRAAVRRAQPSAGWRTDGEPFEARGKFECTRWLAGAQTANLLEREDKRVKSKKRNI